MQPLNIESSASYKLAKDLLADLVVLKHDLEEVLIANRAAAQRTRVLTMLLQHKFKTYRKASIRDLPKFRSATDPDYIKMGE